MLLCLKTADRTQVHNLCKKMQSRFPGLTENDCFPLTRGEAIPGKTDCTPAVLREIYRLALELLESGQSLGDGNANLWGHWFLESQAAGRLAENAGLDGDTARKLGLLHDFGRTVTGTLEHTVRDFELLTDLGWDFEALGCPTHSFLAGGRCASNEQAEKGFYVDDCGQPQWQPGSVKDDVTVFLEHCTYTEYDLILNIADLMASAWAILPPRTPGRHRHPPGPGPHQPKLLPGRADQPALVPGPAHQPPAHYHPSPHSRGQGYVPGLYPVPFSACLRCLL